MVRLQQPTYANCEIMLHWAEKPALAGYFRRHPPTLEWSRPDQIIAALGAGFFIFEGDTIVGAIQLFNNDAMCRSVEFSILIDHEICKDSATVASEVYKQVTDYVFEYLEYQRIAVKLLESATGLHKHVEKYGFKKEGMLRRSCRFQGKLVNEVLYSVLKEEYIQWHP